jgi:quercetin dioxygenase-like cupin family protein
MCNVITVRAIFLHRCRIRGSRIGSREFPFMPEVQFLRKGPQKYVIKRSPTNSGGNMKLIRRELLCLSGIVATVPLMSKIAWAQTRAAPKLTQILRKDLEGQGQVVQETVVSVVDFGPGAAAPWHMHPGAQELLHVIEGNLIVEIEGSGTTLLKTGEAGIIGADLVHLARNENTGASVKALVVHSRAAKDKPLIVVVKK